jgi:hypothetical protein
MYRLGSWPLGCRDRPRLWQWFAIKQWITQDLSKPMVLDGLRSVLNRDLIDLSPFQSPVPGVLPIYCRSEMPPGYRSRCSRGQRMSQGLLL